MLSSISMQLGRRLFTVQFNLGPSYRAAVIAVADIGISEATLGVQHGRQLYI